MSNSKLVSYTKISPSKNSPRNDKIKKITIHHVAGNMTVEQLGALFANPDRKASANYGIGSDGRIAQYVDESDRAWTSGSRENDHQAITIEVANDGAGPAWHVSDAAIASLLDLCEDICRRNGIEALVFTGDATGNLTMHKFFQNTTCPGPYLERLFPEIAKTVNARLGSVGIYRPSVLEWQKAAIADGFSFPRYGADGKWGAECESVAKKAIVKRRNIYMYPNLTKLVQKVVGTEADGKCGPKTEVAIMEYQRNNGLDYDGEVGINTWEKMLGV